MTTPFTYEFGYSWAVAWGHLVPAACFAVLCALSLWRGWRPWLSGLFGVMTAWALASVLVVQFLIRINMPMTLPTDRFLASGDGRVVDVGAGSGRATVGLLLARPRVRVTAVDIYRGYYGIDDNTPERLLANARIAGVADRVDVQLGDARNLPLPGAGYDGVISTYAIDHVDHDGIPKALSEVARVLKPGGEFLLEIVNVDWWVRLIVPVPHGIGAHLRPDPDRWRTLLQQNGFEILEEGTEPATLYFLGRKVAP